MRTASFIDSGRFFRSSDCLRPKDYIKFAAHRVSVILDGAYHVLQILSLFLPWKVVCVA